MEALLEQLGSYAPIVLNAIKAVVFLVVGYIVAGLAKRVVRNQINKSGKIDPTIGNFFSSLVRWFILIVVVIAVLQLFGFEATSLVAVLGASSLAIGLALQGTLSDVAAGVMLIIFRPYRINQYVDIGGTAGTVRDITLFATELTTPDNVQIIMPNSKAWGSVISNYSAHSTRRVDLVFGIDYGDSADDAMKVISKLIEADKRISSDPEPWMRVTNLGDSSVDITVRVWCEAADYWDVKFDMTKSVKEAFDDAGISIPYPHQVEISK